MFLRGGVIGIQDRICIYNERFSADIPTDLSVMEFSFWQHDSVSVIGDYFPPAIAKSVCLGSIWILRYSGRQQLPELVGAKYQPKFSERFLFESWGGPHARKRAEYCFKSTVSEERTH